MELSRCDEDEGSGLHSLPPNAIEEEPVAARDKVDLITRMRFLRVYLNRSVQFNRK